MTLRQSLLARDKRHLDGWRKIEHRGKSYCKIIVKNFQMKVVTFHHEKVKIKRKLKVSLGTQNCKLLSHCLR